MHRFSFEWKPARKENMIIVNDCRITVLTPCMIRVESGAYTDKPTQTVINRDLGAVTFCHERQGSLVTVFTEETVFTVDVHKKVLQQAQLADGTIVRDFERGNLRGTARTLDMANGKKRLEKGIMSRYGASVMDDSKSLILENDGTISQRAHCKDLYYFAYGNDYRRTLRDFYRLTGPIPLIPKYALGNWWSRYMAYTQEEYRQLMQSFMDRKIPITVATIDMDWHWTDVVERFGHDAAPGKDINKEALFYNQFMPGWTGYSWNYELFPNHRELLSWLHEKGFHVAVNVHPSQGIRYFEDCYESVCQMVDQDPAEKRPVKFDVTNLKFLKAYFDGCHHPLESEGVDFWWIDWQQGKLSNLPGLDPLWALNHYHTMDAARENKRPLILSRYAGIGSHRYPLGFSGDTICTWKSLDFQPYFTNNAANAGYSWWSHDIGGHMNGKQDDELYLRWVQYGVFSPINRLHSTNSDFMGKEPWHRSWAVQQVAERFLRLRHKLIPLLYSANWQAHMEGTPICMPMYYRYHCGNAMKTKNQYIFASQLLVAPITEKADPRLNLSKTRVWLPKGRWTDVFTGRIYRGGRWVDMYRDIDSIPVLAQQGSIVPLYQNGMTNDLSLEQPLEMHIWRGNGSFKLYEDDGISMDHERGEFALTEFTVQEKENCLTLYIDKAKGDLTLPKERKLLLHFRDITKAFVKVNGIPVNCIMSDHVQLDIFLNPENTYKVELIDVEVSENRPKMEEQNRILSRVQGGNRWKEIHFPSQKNGYSRRLLPQFIANALLELDALQY